MSDRYKHIALMLLAAARAAGWKHSTAVWDIRPDTVVFSFYAPGMLPFSIAVAVDPALWEKDTSPDARLGLAQDAITAAQSNAALNGLDPTGPSRRDNTETQDSMTHG